jgi:uncharacterized protein DUF937
MPVSLLDSVNELVTPELLSTSARRLGVNEGTAGAALKASFASILVGLAGQTRSPSAMEAAFDVVNDPSNDRPPDDRLGGQLLSTIFGRQRPAVGDLVGRFAGLRAGGGAWLLSLTAPLALGVLRRKISSTGLNPASMSRLLVWERDRILRAAPDGVESLVDAGGRVPEILGVDRVSAPRPSPAQLWHAVAALALVAGVLFLTRDRRTDAEESGMVGGIPFGTMLPTTPGAPSSGTRETWLHW